MTLRAVPQNQRTRYRSTFVSGGVRDVRRAKRDAGEAGDAEGERLDIASDAAIGIVPESWDPNTRQIDVILSTGADVLRYDWWTDREYVERLSLETDHVDLEFLRSGKAPWLRMHRSWDLDAQFGVILPNTAQIVGEDKRASGGENTAQILVRVQLSDAPEDAGVVRKVATGIIRGVSTAYDVSEELVTPPAERGMPELRTATKWAPFEGSSVVLGADSAAGTRSRSDNPDNPTPAVPPAPRQEPTMTIAKHPETGTTLDEAAVRAAARNEEKSRQAGIRQAAKALTLTDGQTQEAIDADLSVEGARDKFFALAAERDNARKISPSHIEVTDDAADKMARGIENAILHRARPGKGRDGKPLVELTDEGRHFRHMSLLDLARDFLETNGVKTRGMSGDEIARRALKFKRGFESTVDFPNIMAAVTGKVLRQAYGLAPITFKEWTRQAPSLPNFKKRFAVQLGQASALEKIPAGGEFRRGSIIDGAESYGLDTYGKMIGIGRRTIIDDDMGALTRLPERLASAAARLENLIVWTLLLSNPRMADGKELFHEDRLNTITDGGLPPGSDDDFAEQLSAMRSLLTKQTDLDGTTILNLQPMFLLVPDRRLLAFESALKSPYFPNSTALVIPESQRKLVIVSDPIMDTYSDKQWYEVADTNQIDGIEWAYLEGQEGPAIDSEIDFDTDGMNLKVRHDFAAGAVDFRGFARNSGEAEAP